MKLIKVFKSENYNKNLNKSINMAMLPVLLDMVDEIYSSLDGQGKKFGDSIPLLFVPQSSNNCQQQQQQRQCRRGPYGGRMWRRCNPQGCGKKEQAAADFQVKLNVKSYKPEEISVKVKDQQVIVEGKHEEREDEHGFVSRQFSRRYQLPADIDLDTVATYLNSDGIMTIKATKPQPPAVESTERVIPIQRLNLSDDEAENVEEKNGENQKVENQTEEKKEEAKEAALD